MLTFLFFALVFVLVLGILVLGHELGHFWAARWNGIKVEEFGFGYPPRLFGIQLFKKKTKDKMERFTPLIYCRLAVFVKSKEKRVALMLRIVMMPKNLGKKPLLW